MALSSAQVRWVAHLARLELTSEEVALFTEQLNQIVDYVNQLQQLDTEGIEPLAHALPVHNVFRADEPQPRVPTLPVEEALANAPDRRGEFYGVPAVLEG
jgi:aspartyl-tRNA(Asn)/glutamyl-tRNA(Gln) amidotransferase subunit C